MQIKNQCRIDFRYNPSLTSPSVPKTIFSNTVSTDIIAAPLKIEKLVNKTKASVFSILTFTIKIHNVSSTPISNIFIKDLAPCNLIPIANTFTLNCNKIRSVDPKEGYTLPFDLAPNSSVTLKFKMVVSPKSSLKIIINSALIEYDYLYNTEAPPLRICYYADSCPTVIENNLVKQLSINKSLELPYHMPSLKKILKECAKVKISEIKLLPTPLIDESDEISYKLLIIGSIKYKILYSYEDPFSCCDSIYSTATISYIQGFSTSIIVPNGTEFFTINNLKSTIENLNCRKINSRTLNLITTVKFNLY